ncbi:hypothetical protein CSQ88_05300 [Iodobacter sp. BJB302]|nr:hypothetical protein CSQ88_05300 [Iodobacter sp. BJB302]
MERFKKISPINRKNKPSNKESGQLISVQSDIFEFEQTLKNSCFSLTEYEYAIAESEKAATLKQRLINEKIK